jgi:hypothetical protein
MLLRGEMVRGGYLTEQETGRDTAQLEDADFKVPAPIFWAG